jgi:hypothetical protein
MVFQRFKTYFYFINIILEFYFFMPQVRKPSTLKSIDYYYKPN